MQRLGNGIHRGVDRAVDIAVDIFYNSSNITIIYRFAQDECNNYIMLFQVLTTLSRHVAHLLHLIVGVSTAGNIRAIL
jgi:hypothetical protein